SSRAFQFSSSMTAQASPSIGQRPTDRRSTLKASSEEARRSLATVSYWIRMPYPGLALAHTSSSSSESCSLHDGRQKSVQVSADHSAKKRYGSRSPEASAEIARDRTRPNS